MSRSLAKLTIDTLEFAREERSVSGELSLAELPRLFGQLAESSVPLQALDCIVSGRHDRRGSWLRLQVSGQFELICQRCLGNLPFVLNIDTELQVIAPGEDWPEEELDDGALALGADAIAAELAQSVVELIEEEVLLALPIAPRHEEGFEACVPPAPGFDKKAASPFAVLAQMKKH